jgi:hypothetical protein
MAHCTICGGDFTFHEIALTVLLRLNNINVQTADLFPPSKSFLLGAFAWAKNTSFDGDECSVCGLVLNNLSDQIVIRENQRPDDEKLLHPG